jgi:pimeloyl-ACP methyl ester carboxylesterase
LGKLTYIQAVFNVAKNGFMKSSLLIACCLFFLCFTSQAQYIEKKWFDKNDSAYGYYTIIKPSSGRIQGALLLIDGYGGNAESFFAETKIHNVAWNNDILTIGIPNGGRLYLDSSMIVLLNRIANEVIEAYKVRKDQFAIGGMSSGGTIALRYAELCNQQPDNYPIQPNAVFNVDGSVDLVGLYKSSERDLKKSNGGWWLNEAQMIIDRLKKEIGDPYTEINKYQAASPMVREAKDSANELLLKNTAVRTYHDIDADWIIKNRNRSLYETNLLDGSEFVNRLFTAGNKNAEFMKSKIPGRRSNGQFHPHSWNIVDEIDLVQWVKKQLNFYPEHLANKYVYPIPTGWETETILFPIEFAPELRYKGFEELRFAPGWGDPKSGEKWAYTLLWWLDGNYQFDERTLKHDLENYFTGLTKQRADASKLGQSLYTPATAQVQKVKTMPGDKDTYTASADIFDAQVTQKPGKLFFKIHVKDCPDKARTLLLLEVAGAGYTEKIWQLLDKINNDFRCVE